MRDHCRPFQRGKETVMRGSAAFFSALTVSLVLSAGAALAKDPMKPTAPAKMMSPDQQKKMHECEQLAAQRNIKMDERARFLMDCMTGKVK
jgi:hypothetical protein